jgi:ATP-dependent Clp protease ATP-binding subunit ClpC
MQPFQQPNKPQEETETELRLNPQTEPEKVRVVDVAKLYGRDSYDLIAKAGKLAFSLKDFYVTTLHVFYEFLETPIAKNLNIQNIAAVKAETLEKIKALPQPKFNGFVFLDPKLKEVLINAYTIARRANSQKISPEHLFISILASDLLQELKLKFSINEGRIEAGIKKEVTIGGYVSQKLPFLEDLSNTFTGKTTFSLIGRENELNQVIRIFGRQNKNNVLIVGEDGVGKDALVYGLAAKIYQNQVPESLMKLKIIKIDLQTLLTSPESLSKFGSKALEEISNYGRVIVFFNEVEFLTNAQQKQLLINYIQLVLKNTQALVICSTKTNFYHENLQNHPVIREFFEVVNIDEPSFDQNMEILRQEGKKITTFHNVSIEENVYEVTIDLAKRFLTKSFFPQKAINLLEESAALASLNKTGKVTTEIVRQVVADKTGVPVQELSVSERERLINLENEFKKYIIGQEQAVFAISEAIKRSRAGLRDPKKPIGSFLFLGPTGVGKTETARVLAKLFFNNEKAFVRLDMSEFSEAHTVQRLLGSPPGYVGYEEGGQLTNPVLERPYSLILLDEIEKANPKVFDIFLQVLDDGRLTDSQGRTADFKNTILIFTSNIGSEEILDKLETFKKSSGPQTKSALPREELIPILRNYFRPEFINRFDDIVIFNALGVPELVEIAKLKIARIQDNLKEKNIHLEIGEERLKQMVQAAYDPAFGARPIERMLREQVENKIAHAIIAGELNEGDAVKIS